MNKQDLDQLAIDTVTRRHRNLDLLRYLGGPDRGSPASGWIQFWPCFWLLFQGPSAESDVMTHWDFYVTEVCVLKRIVCLGPEMH